MVTAAQETRRPAAQSMAPAEVIARGGGPAVTAWVERAVLPDGRVSLVARARPTSADYAAADYAYVFTVDAPDVPGASPTREVGAFTLAAGVTTAFTVVRLRSGQVGRNVGVRLTVTDADGAPAVDLSAGPTVGLSSEAAPAPTAQAARAESVPPSPARRPLPPPSLPPAATAAPELEIDGLIIDETRTKLGRDFYDLFYGRWDAPAGATNYSITLSEAPARGRTVRLTVEVDGQPVYRRMLQPRLSLLEESAEQAARAVSQHLAQRSRISQQIELEDQSASGI